MTQIIAIHNLVNPKSGKTRKEENLEQQHNIPIGTLVEIQVDSESDAQYDGVRLYVVGHTRDCDGTPLYQLGMKNASLKNPFLGDAFYAFDTFGGFAEDYLKIIKNSEAEEI